MTTERKYLIGIPVLCLLAIALFAVRNKELRYAQEMEARARAAEAEARREDSPHRQLEREKAKVIDFAKFKVKQQLKSPATAVFDEAIEYKTVRRDNGEWWIAYATVDSQNGFGALVRSYWTAMIVKDDAEILGWRMMKLDLE